MKTIDRHQFPIGFHVFMAEALRLDLVDSITVMELTSKFGDDIEAIAEEVMEYAWACQHDGRGTHGAMCRVFDATCGQIRAYVPSVTDELIEC